MKYAVIAISGSQYKIEENQTITVDLLQLEVGKTGTTDQVLLTVDGDKVNIGTPLVDKALVEYEVLKHYQGEKIRVFKYKSKSKYRLTKGHRSQLTDIKITKIKF